MALVALAACLLAPPAAAVNLDWIPADPDGPLPASREYRDRLFQLCIAMRKTPAFFAEIDASRQTVIRSLCRRLREAERAERLPYEYAAGHQQASKLWLLLLGAGIATIWYYRIKEGSPIQSWWSRKRMEKRKMRRALFGEHAKQRQRAGGGSAGGGPAMTAEEKETARLARLARFEQASQRAQESPGDAGDRDLSASKKEN